MRVLILGGDSVIGVALREHFEAAGDEVSTTTRRKPGARDRALFLDLGREPSLVDGHGEFDVAIVCAAVTNQKKCAEDPNRSRQVNVHGTVCVVERLVGRGCFVVFLSTSLVFDGTVPYARVDDPRRPRGEYGRQKAEAEDAVLRLGGTAVVRLTKVLHRDYGLFAQWRATLREGKSIRAFSDLACAPLSLSEAVPFVAAIARERWAGIWHLSGREDVSYATMAAALAKIWQVDPALVVSVPAEEAGLSPEYAPQHTTLDTRRAEEELGFRPPSWEITLAQIGFEPPGRIQGHAG